VKSARQKIKNVGWLSIWIALQARLGNSTYKAKVLVVIPAKASGLAARQAGIQKESNKKLDSASSAE